MKTSDILDIALSFETIVNDFIIDNLDLSVIL